MDRVFIFCKENENGKKNEKKNKKKNKTKGKRKEQEDQFDCTYVYELIRDLTSGIKMTRR